MDIYRKKALIEVVGIKKNGDRVVQNEGEPSDRWVIDKETFENTYEKIKVIDPEKKEEK